MSMLNELYEDTSYEMLDETLNVLNEVNKVVFDKATKKKRLLRQAELICAKEAGDDLYVKYLKFTKGRKKVRALIHNKYENKAKVKVKEYLKRRKETREKEDKK